MLPPREDALRREIGVLVKGRCFSLAISDDHGQPLGVAQLAQGISHILSTTRSHVPGEPVSSFPAASYLGSQDSIDFFERLLSDPENANTYGRLKEMLFTIALTTTKASEPDRLRTALTEPDLAWVRKPIGYQLDLAGDRIYMRVEHSTIDGGTVKEATRRMQQVRPHHREGGPVTVPAELHWRMDEDMIRELNELLSRYRSDVERLRIEIKRVPRIPEDQFPFRMSADALQQFIMTAAQLLTYGRVRSVYESVDMRAFKAGRTECLRPVTPEAVAFSQAMISGHAEKQDLQVALDAHRSWVKACKSGNGFERHLTGLEMIAERNGVQEPFFSCEALETLRTDFLSTTSLGSADLIVRYAFAPSVSHGFGINYTPHPDAFEYCVSYDSEHSERHQQFLSNISEAARLLYEFIAGLPHAEQV